MSKTKTEQKTVSRFEIIDHGIDHAQYFQGCGVCWTNFDDVAIGCGENPMEAYNEALESLAMNGWDVQPIVESTDGKEFNEATKPSVSAYILKTDGEPLGDDEDCELYYYVSIRVA